MRIDVAFALATALALLLPVVVSVAAARRRGGDLVAQTAAILLGIGIALVGVWNAAAASSLSAGAVAAGGVAAALVASLGLIGPRSAGTAADTDAGARHLVPLLVAGLLMIVVCAVPFTPFGSERGDQVQRLSMTDWEKHLMFTTELVAFDDVPPRNPFLRESGASPYYEGFHLLASLPARATGGTDRIFASLLGMTLLTVLLLPFAVYALAMTLVKSRPAALLAALAATFFGGFDVIVLGLDAAADLVAAWPLAGGLEGLRELVPSINPDYWIHHNERQFYPPYRTAIWAPQHLMSALVASVILARLWDERSAGRPLRDGVPLGIGLVAVAMLSAYTAIAMAVGLAAVAVTDAVRERGRPGWSLWRSVSPLWLSTGATALAVGLPFALHLAGSPSAGLQLALSSAGSWRNGALFTTVLGDGTLARLLDTPAVLMVELGLIGVLGIVGIRRMADGASRRSAIFCAAVVVLVVLFRPPVDGPNNLYGRGLMTVWLLLAPYAALAARSALRQRRRAIAIAAVVCLAYTPYAMLGATLEGYLFWGTPRPDHAVATWVGSQTPATNVVAFDPQAGPRYFTYWARRAIVFDDPRLALLFGSTPEQAADTERVLTAAYQQTSARDAARTFRDLGADLVVVDGATAPANSWAASGCFLTSYRRDGWLVVAPVPDSCDR